MPMDKKEIHIVFQVLNFLKSKHHAVLITSHFEHKLLLFLASHKGQKGIFPSIPTLAQELHCSTRYVQNGLRKWASLEIIEIQENDGKPHHYYLNIPYTTPKQEFTPVIEITPVVHDTPEQEFTPPLNYSSSTPEQEFTINNKVITNEVTNKSFYMQKYENEKKHDFADSKNQMANEARHIEESEKIKNSPIPESIKEQFRNVKNININPLKRIEVPDDRDHQAKSLEILRQKLISEGKLTRI